MSEQLNKLNCMNYQVQDSDGDFWYAQCGLRSLYEYSKITNQSFRTICLTLLDSGQIELVDIRDNDNEELWITMI